MIESRPLTTWTVVTLLAFCAGQVVVAGAPINWTWLLAPVAQQTQLPSEEERTTSETMSRGMLRLAENPSRRSAPPRDQRAKRTSQAVLAAANRGQVTDRVQRQGSEHSFRNGLGAPLWN